MGNSSELIHVMLVDDHKIVLWGLQKLIESDTRLKLCAIANNPNEALEKCELYQPDVVLLNLDLHHSSDDHFLKKLTSHSNTKVIAFSSSKNNALHDDAIVKGARGVLTKEDEPHQLLKAIECVHQGELWLNRTATSRIFLEIANAKAPASIKNEHSVLSSLTRKELHVYQAVVASSDKTLRAIAGALNTSEHTLRNHLASIYSKLGVNNRLELFVLSTQLKH